VELAIQGKEQELKALRQELRGLKNQYDSAMSVQVKLSAETQQVSALKADECTTAFEKAITSYEKAAGLLRFVECVRPDWKNDDGSYKGIEDDWLRVDDTALREDSVEREEVQDMITSCYLNIALVSQKLQKFEQMRKACDEVLSKVNDQNVKAFYRRAQARVAPVGALDSDRDAAIEDLVAAAKIAPQDKDVRSLLSKLRAEKRRNETDDRNKFAGMFERGEVVTNDPRQEGDPQKPIDWDLRDPRVQNLLDIRPGPDAYVN